MVRTICYPVCILALVPSLAWAAWAETPYIVDSPYYTYKLEGAKMQSDGSVSATRTYVRRVQPPAIYTGPVMPDKLRISSIVTKANVAKLLRGSVKGGIYGTLAVWAFDEFINKYGLEFSNGDFKSEGQPYERYVPGFYYGLNGNYAPSRRAVPEQACEHHAGYQGWPGHSIIPNGTYPDNGKPQYICRLTSGASTWNIPLVPYSCGNSSESYCQNPGLQQDTLTDDQLLDKFDEFNDYKNGTQLPKLLTRPDGLAVRTPDAITVENDLKDQWNNQTGDTLDGATANNPTWDTEYYNPNGTLKDPQIAAGNGTPSSTTTTTTTNPSTGETTTTTTTTPGSSPSSDSEWPEFCTWASVVCSALEWLTADHEFEDAPAVDVTTNEQPTYSSGLGSGVCPAPIHVDLGQYGAVDIEYTMLCDLVTRLRPLLLVLFYISGVYIVIRSN